MPVDVLSAGSLSSVTVAQMSDVNGGGSGIEDVTGDSTYMRKKGAWVDGAVAVPEFQTQPDWSQSDNSKADFIKNKPSIPPAYTLPAATTSVLGGVKQAAKQTDLAGDADAAAIVTGVNALMAALRDAGIMAK